MEPHIIQFPGIVWKPGKVATEVCRTLSAFAWCIGTPLTLNMVDAIEQVVIATTPTNRIGRRTFVAVGPGVVLYDNGVHDGVGDNGNIPSLTFTGFPGCQGLVKNVSGWRYEDGRSFRLVLNQRPELIHSLNGEIVQQVLAG